MTRKTAAQLDRDIQESLRTQSVDVRKLFAWAPKMKATVVDVAEGRTSRSNHEPVKVSRLDAPRGSYWIVDGHHRAVEAVLRGDRTLSVVIDENIPRIERTGGAYASVLADRVNVASYVRPGSRS